MASTRTDAVNGRVAAHVLQGRTDAAGVEQVDEHVDGEDLRIPNSAFTSGVMNPAEGFQVLATAPTPDMDVHVGSGTIGDTAVLSGSEPQQGSYRVSWPDADTTVSIPAADLSNDRIDEIYLVVEDDAYDLSGRVLPALFHRDGTPAATPEAPGPDPNWTASLLLAEVLVPAAALEITQGNITDSRLFAGVRLGAVERLSALLNGNTVLDAPAGGLITMRIDGNNELLVGPSALNLVGNEISNVGNVDGVDVSAHRHDGADSAALAVDSVTASQIAPDAVTASEIAPDAVTASELAADAVTASELAGGSVASQITTQRNQSGTNVLLTASFQDVVQFTFNKPSGWGTYEALIEAVYFGGGASNVESRVRLGANSGASITQTQANNDRFTGISGSSNVAALQVRDTTDSGTLVTSAVISGVFIRTS